MRQNLPKGNLSLPVWDVVPGGLNVLFFAAGHSAKVAPRRRPKNANHRRNVVTGNHRHSRSPSHGYQTGHKGWRRSRISTCDRNVLKLLQSVRAILRRLSRDLVTNTILRIYPECG